MFDSLTPEQKARIERQVDLAERLQDLLLREYEARLSSGDISDTGMANLQKLLMHNGWSIDPSKLPQGLAGVLTTAVDLELLDADDEDVIDLQSRLSGTG